MMQRFTCIATFELGIAVRTSVAWSWRNNLTTKQPIWRPWAYLYSYSRPTRPNVERAPSPNCNLHNLRRQSALFVSHKCRHYSTGSDNEPKNASSPGISVVGIPDPITWVRNKVVMFLIGLYFDLSITNVEFDQGVKQAVVYVSTMMSNGKFEELRGVMSNEAVEYVKKKCKTLTEAQRRNLAISFDDIIFLLPEDVSLFFDHRGRKFCYIVMRFWHLSSADVPEDPESNRMFKMADTEGDGPPKKIVTAVYEFHRELTHGAEPDWTVTHIWHWKQLE